MSPIQSRHHLKCRSHGGTWDRDNIAFINDKFHKAWHLIFGNCCAYDIAEIINAIFLDPDYKLVVEVRNGN